MRTSDRFLIVLACVGMLALAVGAPALVVARMYAEAVAAAVWGAAMYLVARDLWPDE